MNKKEETLHRVLCAVVDSCSYINSDGTTSITLDMVKSVERIGDNINMTRCIVARQLNRIGYNNESIAHILRRSESTIRDLLKRDDVFYNTRFAYRVASDDATKRVNEIIKGMCDAERE